MWFTKEVPPFHFPMPQRARRPPASPLPAVPRPLALGPSANRPLAPAWAPWVPWAQAWSQGSWDHGSPLDLT